MKGRLVLAGEQALVDYRAWRPASSHCQVLLFSVDLSGRVASVCL